MDTDLTKEFDENEAIKFIRNYVPASIKNKYTDDDILLLIDTMYDYYENEDDEEVYEDESSEDYEAYLNRIVNYVKKCVRKDEENNIEMEDVKSLILGEIEYEKTLDND